MVNPTENQVQSRRWDNIAYMICPPEGVEALIQIILIMAGLYLFSSIWSLEVSDLTCTEVWCIPTGIALAVVNVALLCVVHKARRWRALLRTLEAARSLPHGQQAENPPLPAEDQQADDGALPAYEHQADHDPLPAYEQQE